MARGVSATVAFLSQGLEQAAGVGRGQDVGEVAVDAAAPVRVLVDRARQVRLLGRELDVLVEGPSRTDPDKLRGRTRHNKTVNFTGMAQPGEFARVEIASATSTTLAGEESLLARLS